MQSSNSETERFVANLIALVRQESFRPSVFKGKIVFKAENPEECVVRIFENTEVKALLLQFGTGVNHLKLQIKEGDDVLLLKTENAGYLALPIILNDVEPERFAVIGENIAIERRESKLFISIDGVSLLKTVLDSLNQLKEGLEKAKSGFEAVQSNGNAASVEPALKAVAAGVVPAIQGLGQAIGSIASLNETIGKLTL